MHGLVSIFEDGSERPGVSRATYGDLSPASFSKLQAEWTANVSAAAVVRAGKRPVLWQPTVQGPGDPAWDGALPADSVYMIWLNAESAQKYAANGSDVVYTTPFYVAGMGSGGWTQVCALRLLALLRVLSHVLVRGRQTTRRSCHPA